MCTDPHVNLPEIVDHPGTFDIVLSTYYALGHTYSILAYYFWMDCMDIGIFNAWMSLEMNELSEKNSSRKRI